jgi:hypothetical protein
MAIAGDVFGPAVAALTLGLFARAQLAPRMGRNAAFDHAGNVAIALLAGLVGTVFSQRAVFLLVPLCAMLTMIAVLSIPGKAIDYDRARDLDSASGASLSGLVAGEIVDHFGYDATFLALGAAALVALIVFALGMPETANLKTVSPSP